MPIDGLLVATRFGLYADLAALAGLPLFWWSMRQDVHTGARRILALLAFGGLILSALWLIASAAAMTGTSPIAPDWSVIKILLQETAIGPLLAIRAIALLMIPPLLCLSKRPMAPVALLAMAAAITLAWSGHAGAAEGADARPLPSRPRAASFDALVH